MSKTTFLFYLITSNNFCNFINSPTRVTSSSSTLLDVFVTNQEVSSVSAGVLEYSLSDHLPIFMLINNITYQKIESENENRRTIRIRSINSATLEKFRETISNTNWDPVFSATSADEAYNEFLAIFKKIYENSFPYRQLKQAKKNRKPWVTRKCLKLINKKK